jgi:hypothetical protein
MREALRLAGVSFYARAGMDVSTNGGRLLLNAQNNPVVSADLFLLNTGFCIDAGDLG